SKLGYAIDIDGDTAVVGAKDYDGRGAAFVYRYDAGSNLWNFEAKLQAEGIRLGDDYGTSVSVSGDTVVVGATDAQGGAGAAYVYQRLGNAWSETATLTGGVNGMDFGRAVDVDVDTIAVGSTDELGGAASAGRVHFFRLGVSGWQQTQTVIGSTAGFGSALGLDKTSLVVGAPDTANGDGAAEVYLFQGTSWMLQASLVGAGTAGDGGAFGLAVAISGEAVIVGAPFASNEIGNEAGAAYLFERIDSNWTQKQKLVLESSTGVDNGLDDDFFGHAVALEGDLAIVGAYGRDVVRNGLTLEAAGQAYSYQRSEAGWRLETVSSALRGGDAAAGDFVGYAIALSGGTAVLGAPQLGGRIGPDAIDTDGAGYAFFRSVSAPVTLVTAESMSQLIQGAQANTIGGTLGGQQTASFNFFDITKLELTTGDQSDRIAIKAPGLTAYGLADFSIETAGGEDTVAIEGTRLSPPASGAYRDANNFDPTNPIYQEVTGAFRFEGGLGTDTLST
ncbi:MAG: FG-GAP repeat protein, partial [Pirellulaceae bacterium]